MDVTALWVFVTSISLIAAGVMFYWWRADQLRVKKLGNERTELSHKLDETRAEVGALKEDSRKKRSELVEAREQIRKLKRKNKRAGKAEDGEAIVDAAEVQRLKAEIKKLEKALEGAEARVQRVQEHADGASQQALSKAQEDARDQVDKDVAELEQQVQKLNSDLKASRRREKQLRGEMKVDESDLDLQNLPVEVIATLRRYVKKASNMDRLYTIEHGELEVLRDKHDEMTRRYFAVCRELALAAGRDVSEGDEGDRDAARIAVDITQATEQAARKKIRRSRRPTKRSTPQNDAAETPEHDDGGTDENTDESGITPDVKDSTEASLTDETQGKDKNAEPSTDVTPDSVATSPNDGASGDGATDGDNADAGDHKTPEADDSRKTDDAPAAADPPGGA